MEARPEPAAKLFLSGALICMTGTIMHFVGPALPPNAAVADLDTWLVLIGLALALIGTVIIVVAFYRFMSSVDFLVKHSGVREPTERADHPCV